MILKLRNESDIEKLLTIFDRKGYNRKSTFGKEWSEGIHFKANTKFINIWYDEGPKSHLGRGDPIQAHFYGYFVKLFGKCFLIGFRSFNIIMATVFFFMIFRSLGSLYALIPALFLIICIFSSVKDFENVKTFILSSYEELTNKTEE